MLGGCTRVSNAGVQSLIAGKPLTWLRLEGVSVTDEILPTIQGLPLAANLTIYLSEGHQVSEAGLAGLREAVSEVRISARSYYSYY